MAGDPGSSFLSAIWVLGMLACTSASGLLSRGFQSPPLPFSAGSLQSQGCHPEGDEEEVGALQDWTAQWEGT